MHKRGGKGSSNEILTIAELIGLFRGRKAIMKVSSKSLHKAACMEEMERKHNSSSGRDGMGGELG
ncbi:MAG: hypothetical protein MJE68_09785 [Proteobacteria bacterium]|nr:hypothetical protein [Pseudomonadota bacterium]